MKKVYVAGPIRAETGWEREQNIRRAEEIGMLVIQSGFSPFMPHAQSRFIDGVVLDETWIEADLEWLEASDVMVVVVGPDGYKHSKGTMTEIAFSDENNIPLFYWDYAERMTYKKMFSKWVKKVTDRSPKNQGDVSQTQTKETEGQLDLQFLEQCHQMKL